MIQLGETFRDIKNNTILTDTETTWLWKDIEKTLTAFLESTKITDRVLNSDVQDGEYALGGYFYIMEDTDDDFRKLFHLTSRDIRSDTCYGWDLAEYLDPEKTLAIVALVTSNDGGPSFIFRKDILDKYPCIRKQIVNAYEWIK